MIVDRHHTRGHLVAQPQRVRDAHTLERQHGPSDWFIARGVEFLLLLLLLTCLPLFCPRSCAAQPFSPRLQVKPVMRPFYLWFAGVTAFLIASVAPVPFSVPAPWAGVLLAALVLSVSALPVAYGRVYLTTATLGHSRQASTDCEGGEALGVGDVAEGIASGFRLEEDLFGREAYPLLGPNGVAERVPGSLTWKECLRVSFAAKVKTGVLSDVESGLACPPALPIL